MSVRATSVRAPCVTGSTHLSVVGLHLAVCLPTREKGHEDGLLGSP